MIYFDTSYLTKLYVFEAGSRDVLTWLEGQGGLVCGAHGRIELIASFKRHQREGTVDARGFNALHSRLVREETAGHLRWLPLEPELILQTCRKVAELPPPVFLRAAEALHLACAVDAGLKEIYSHDRHLLAAAPHFGLRGLDVIKPA